MADKVTIALVSDLHCTSKSGKDSVAINTHLTSDLLPNPIERNPVEALKKLGISADYLLCPGDITDKAEQQGLVSGWRFLEDIHRILKTKLLIATSGNHDVDSRNLFNSDAIDTLKRISDYPTSISTENNNYWGKHFCILSEPDCDFLIFNSSYIQKHKESANVSKITDTTIKQINDELNTIKDNDKVKICLLHHHPVKHSNMDYIDGDSVEKGDDFLKMLSTNNFNLVIHGHKHDPRLNYYFEIPVLAAGSFSSTINITTLGNENTFHLIEVDKTSKKGIIKTWVYGPRNGWAIKHDTYFPCYTGFGAKINLNTLAGQCIKWIESNPTEFIKYEDLLLQFPDLEFLIPDEQIKFNELLENSSIKFIPVLPNRPTLVSKIHKL